MRLANLITCAQVSLGIILIASCSAKKNYDVLESELKTIDLARGEIALCTSSDNEFGSVSFDYGACSEKVKTDFNLAIALLHSFEYKEAEKMFAKVIDEDPACVMAYWGVAMCNFHPLWVPPNPAELEKGSKIIMFGREVVTDKTTRESEYLEAIATIYDQWNTLDHRTRLLKYEEASRKIYEKYPADEEAAIFYALALDAAANPLDKTFQKQKKAGEILNAIFINKPNHPGIAHYIIHNYDYPELAELGLSAARKYASIAPASAHAQHMPSHIFIRLGLWDEAVLSNANSVSSAQCYAENSKMKGHWDEELHGLDYLLYAYLQQANDTKASEQINYLKTIKEVSPVNFKVAYCFAAMPARYTIERKDWATAAQLKHEPASFPWQNFLWESANINFARLLGAVHTHQLEEATKELQQLESMHDRLVQANKNYEANFVLIQINASRGWIKLEEGNKKEAIAWMTEAANKEDATTKHPVTPGEILPARELLADMYLALDEPKKALVEYEEDLKRHPNRFNGLYGAGLAAEKSGDNERAKHYYQKLLTVSNSSDNARPEWHKTQSFLKN